MENMIRRALAILASFGILVSQAGGLPGQQVHASVSGFVTRSGSTLQLNGNTFKFAGGNLEDAALWRSSASVTPAIQYYPSHYQIDDAMATAQEMGLTVMRVWEFATYGCTACMEPSEGVFNENALRQMDYIVYSASAHGIRLVLPFSNQCCGLGNDILSGWAGVPTSQFYSSATTLSYYETTLSTILNRTNTYSGVAYRNDPAVMAWETGNEMDAAPAAWTQTVASYIKDVDGNHLVMDGNTASVQSGEPGVDVYTRHYYGSNSGLWWNSSSANAAGALGRAFVVGEYGWNQDTEANLKVALGVSERTPGISGDLFWVLELHDNRTGWMFPEVGNAGAFSLDYPGQISDYRLRIQDIRVHAYTMQGLGVPAHATPPAPSITGVSGATIYWRGSAGTDSYSVERSTTGPGSGFFVICNKCATDFTAAYLDTTQPGGPVWYRVQPYNLDGSVGSYSQSVQSSAASNVALQQTATADSAYNSACAPSSAVDGSLSTKWCSTASSGTHWLQLDLGQVHSLTRWVVRHAGAGGETPLENTLAFTLQGSGDGSVWTDLDLVGDNLTNVTDRSLSDVSVRFVRLNIVTPTDNYDSYARIFEFELYGGATGSPGPAILNPGFESPPLPPAGIQAYPAPAGYSFWSFGGNDAGITGNGSGFTVGNPNAPEGSQVAYLQQSGTISQSLGGFQAGQAYSFTFAAAQRGNWNQANQTIQVYLDRSLLGTYTPSGTSYADITTSPVTPGLGTHTLTLVGTDPGGTDDTAFIDNVRVNVLGTPCSGGNLVTNCGFETGDLTGWTASGGSLAVASDAHLGSYAGKVAANGGGLFQTVTVAPSTTYTLTGWGKVTSGGDAFAIGVQNYGGNQVYVPVTGTSYGQVSVQFTTGSGNTTAQIFCYKGAGNGNGVGYCDDISVVQN